MPVAQLDFVSATPSQGSCGPPTGAVLTCAVGAVDAGAVAPVVVVMDVPADFDGADVTNTVEVTSTTPDPDPADNTATFISSTAPQADLSVVKAATPDPFVAGEPFTYTVTVTNNGPFAATSVSVHDLVPDGLSSVGASGPGFNCVIVANSVTCTMPTLAVGASATLTITATVDADLAAGSALTNVATVSSATPDPTSSNNTGTALSSVATRPNLVTTKQLVDPAPPLAVGDFLVFQITVTNDRPSLAREVSLLDDDIGLELGVVDIVGDIGLDDCVISTGDLIWARGDIAPLGGSRTFFLIAITLPDQALGTFANSATASTTTPDPDGEPPEAVAVVDVLVIADLVITKEVESPTPPAPLVAGQRVTYRISVTNNGPSTPPTWCSATPCRKEPASSAAPRRPAGRARRSSRTT